MSAAFFRTDIADGVLTITLDARDASVNTLSPDWIAALSAAIDAAAANAAVTGLIVTSAKAGFMAGADLRFIADTPMTAAEAFAFSQAATGLMRRIETCGKPVVAAINGLALGGGYELALACTHRIVADVAHAVVGLPEVNLGLLPAAGGTQRLPRMIGPAKASEILLGGASYRPGDALARGLVDEVVAPDDLLAAARRWLASGPSSERSWDAARYRAPGADGVRDPATAAWITGTVAQLGARYGDNYPAPLAILTCIVDGVQVPIDKGLLIESREFAALMAGPVSRNIIRTTFIDKGLAAKGARRPAGVPKSTVTRLGILGAGMMGAGIAHAAANVGIDVVLLDTTRAAADRGKAYSEKLVSKLVARGGLSQQDAARLSARITPTTDYSALAGVDMVVEAVFEDTAIKADVTRRAEAVIPDTAVFASNTSTLPITQLAAAFGRPADFIGLHFFSPVERMALVEVISGRATSPETLARALDFVARLRKVPILVNDSRGFYTSRVFQTYIHEGIRMVGEGVVPALIENVARHTGMPVGPLALTDEVTLELPRQIVDQTAAEVPAFRKPASMAVIETMIDRLGRPSRKGGGGFYDYGEDGSKRLWAGLADAFPLAAEQPDAGDVRKRLLYVQALETARCFEEGVLTHPSDADLGSVFGWGFPTWTGGTLSLIETVGTRAFVAECDRLAAIYGERFAVPDGLRTMAVTDAGFDRS